MLGKKKCEIRFNDRDYQIGDALQFFDCEKNDYVEFTVTHIHSGLCLKENYVALSVERKVKEPEKERKMNNREKDLEKAKDLIAKHFIVDVRGFSAPISMIGVPFHVLRAFIPIVADDLQAIRKETYLEVIELLKSKGPWIGTSNDYLGKIEHNLTEIAVNLIRAKMEEA